MSAEIECRKCGNDFDQLGIDRDEGDLTKRRIKEIERLIKTTDYNGGW
jgi:hypothetical protein